MTATVRVYACTDTGAPTLNGTAGSLITVLDAILVNGYGSGAHPAAGWTKPYTGTNLAAYLSGAGTPQPYVYVDDTGTQDSRIVTYGAMTSISAGTDPSPSSSLLSGGGYCRKSSTADSTARAWYALACERFIHFFTYPGTTSANLGLSDTAAAGFRAGVFPSYKSGDAWNIFCQPQTSATTQNQGAIFGFTAPSWTAQAGVFTTRSFTQIGGAINSAVRVPGTSSPGTSGSTNVGQNCGGAYPSPITGGLRLSRLIICENDGNGYTDERGYVPGAWSPMHTNSPGSNFDTFSGTGALSGKTFVLVPTAFGSTNCKIAIENSGSWNL